MALAGVPVGEKYLNKKFPDAIETAASEVLSTSFALALNAPLPALGIPSDLEFWLDSNTIGQIFRAVRSTVLIMGFTVSTPSNKSSTPIFVDAPTEGIDGRCAAGYDLVLESVRAPPWNLSLEVLGARLAIAIGDGHYADGEDSRHTPSRVLESLFIACGRVPRISWTGFHRIDKAGTRACWQGDSTILTAV